jgi:tetratricopeptide (TPR) repeat protein
MMTKKSFLTLITTLTLFSLSSFIWINENSSENEALIVVEEDFSVSADLVESYKTTVIKEVFGQLKMAKGDFRSVKPKLNFVKQIPDGGRIAVAYPTVGVIYFEEKMYDVCASLGKDSTNALAAVLGHELTHCYQNHTWEDNFKKDFQKTQMDSVLRDRYMDDEIQADYLGGFLAYAAGFYPFGIMPALYEKEYEAYNLTDAQLAGDYPPMKERIQIAEESERKLRSLIDYFEIANLLTAIGKYEDALAYYNAIEGEFQSREIYNNIGVVTFLSVLKEFEGMKMPYAFPVELDAQSRLSSMGRGGDELDPIEKLQKAIEYFEKAKSMDSFYPIAWLNLGCAHALLGYASEEYQDLEYDEAEIAAKRALRLAKSDDKQNWDKTVVDAYILLGLVEALRNNEAISPLIKEVTKMMTNNEVENIEEKRMELKTESEFAIDYLNKALKLDSLSQLALYNKAKLEGQNIPVEDAVPQGLIPRERIEDKRIVDLSVNRSDIRKDLYLPQGMIFAVKNYDHSQFLVNNVSGPNKRTISFYLTSLTYDQESDKGVKLGDDYKTVTEKYPNPPNPVGLGEGYFLVYRNPMIIFQFDNGHILKRWAIYRW